MVDIRLLRYLVAVADSGSVAGASRALQMSQPSLSRQLRVLERELGLQLFVRGTGPLRLSAAGHGFLPIARDLLIRHGRALSAARSMSTGSIQRLRIAASATTIADVLAPFIGSHADGAVRLAISEAQADCAYEAVDAGGADLALSITAAPPHLANVHIADFYLYAYVSDTHSWAQRSRIDLAELAGPPLILTPSSGSFRVLIPALERERLQYSLTDLVPIPRVALALAAAGHGVAVLSDDPVFGVHALTITSANKGPLMVSLFASWDPNHYGVLVLERLARDLRTFCAAHWPLGDGNPIHRL